MNLIITLYNQLTNIAIKYIHINTIMKLITNITNYLHTWLKLFKWRTSISWKKRRPCNSSVENKLLSRNTSSWWLNRRGLEKFSLLSNRDSHSPYVQHTAVSSLFKTSTISSTPDFKLWPLILSVRLITTCI